MSMSETEQDPEKMAQRSATIDALLMKDLFNVVERYRKEYYMTYSQMIGSFDIVKSQLIEEAQDTVGD